MKGPMNLLDGFNATLIGMVARTQHPDPELEYDEYELERKKGRPSRPPSSRRRRDDPSVLSRISDATKIRSGVMTKEQIPVCSTTKYGSDLPCERVPKKSVSILRGCSGKKGRIARPSFKHQQDSCSESTVISTVTESPMPINVSSIYSSAEWKRKFHEKEEAKAASAAAAQVRGGRKNKIHTVDPTSPQPRHYYVGLRSTKNPLGKKPNINARQSMILSSYLGSDLTSHHLNSLPSSRFTRDHRAENKHSKNSISGSVYDGETIESGSVANGTNERESAGRTFNEPSLSGMGRRQVSSVSTFGPNQSTNFDKYGHRYGNYSFPEKSEADGTASTHLFSNNMPSGSTSISSRSVRIRTKRRGAENDVIELELLPEEKSDRGDTSSNNDDDSSSQDANLMDDRLTELALPDDEDVNDVVHIVVGEVSGSAEERGKPKLPIVVNVHSSGFVSTCTSMNSSSVASSASSQITSNRSRDIGDKPSPVGAVKAEGANANPSAPDHNGCADALVTSADVPSLPDAGSVSRKQAAAPSSADSMKKQKNLSSDLNVGSVPLPSYSAAQGCDCGDIDKYQAPDEVSTASSRTAASSSAASSSDEAQYMSCETQRNINGTVKPVPNTDKIIVKQSVEDDVLAPTYAPMQNDTSLVQDKRDQEKQSGFVKETVENMLESAFSPDGEYNRSYDNVGKRTRTFRPKIPLFDSMTSSESSGQVSKDWRDVESWCRSVPENSVIYRSHYERRTKYLGKQNRAGWYARPKEEIKNRKGIEVDVVQVGLKKKRVKARGNSRTKGQSSW